MCVRDTPRALLDRAIRSILEQSFEDFEFLILDDGSQSEETREALECVRDLRVRLYREPHRGLTASLNVGLSRARGELIARQDADDWSARDRLALQTAFFRDRPEHALAGSAAWTHQQDGTPLWPVAMPETHQQIRSVFWSGNPFFHGAAMFRREAAARAGGYREALPCSQDYDFFWRLSEIGRAANLRQPLYHYRYRSGSISSGRAAEQAQAHRAAVRLARDRARGIPEDVAAALAEAAPEKAGLADCLKQADHLTLAGDYAPALRGYLKAIRKRPVSPLAWAKLFRLGVFRAAPPARELCFR
jgi:glycosyltransferase involved in cell wall biosynthesis